MGTVTLTAAVYEAMRAHGEESYPQECCGVLLGAQGPDGWQVLALLRAGNAEGSRNRYRIAPEELVEMAREAGARGLAMAGFYHSHPDHPAWWSESDLAEAQWPGCAYVVTAVDEGKAQATHAFLLEETAGEGKRFRPQRVVVL